jgi:hypothetical protein
MKSMLAWLPLLLLVGCERNKEGSVSIPGLTHSTPAPAAAPQVWLVAGQSNGVRWATAGYKGWNDARNAADTFINCAENGTTMAQWDPNGSRFQNCIAQVAGRRIDGIIWAQGESDANPAIGGSAADYAYKATQLFSAFRSQFGDVPILYMQIGIIGPSLAPSFPNWQQVKDQQASIFVSRARMVRTDDINPAYMHVDGIHWEEPGLYEIGARAAREFSNATH